MTELEILQRARMYIDKLANGVNPLDDSRIAENEVVNQVRISKCLSYVSTVLTDVIVQEEKRQRKREDARAPFALEPEQRNRFPFSDEPVTVSQITGRMCGLIDETKMKGIAPVKITNGLVRCGVLKIESREDGKTEKRPTEMGTELGITTELREGRDGQYTLIRYSREAQKYILDHLDSILQEHDG